MKELECGITKIYDIPLDVEQSRNKMITNSFSDSVWRIPAYQRGYKWSKEQFVGFKDALEEFIEDSDSNNTYFGQIIVHSNEKGEFEIVDGQQRLTTFMLLSKIILDDKDKISNRYQKQLAKIYKYLYTETGERRIQHQNLNRKYIDQYVFLDEPCGENDHKNINDAFLDYCSHKDEAKYREIIEKTYRSRGINQYKADHYNSIVTSYNYLKSWYDKLSASDAGFLLEGVCSKIDISYLISLKFDTAYESFLSLNVKGKPLQNFDIIKSVFMGELNIDGNSIEKEWEDKIDKADITESKIVDVIEYMLKLEYSQFTKKENSNDLIIIKGTELHSIVQKIFKECTTYRDKRIVFDKLTKYIEYYIEMKKGNFADIIGNDKYAQYNESVSSLMDMNYVPFIPLIFEYIRSSNHDDNIEEIINIAKYSPFIYVTVFGQKSTKLTKLSNDYLSYLEDGIERCEAIAVTYDNFRKLLPNVNFVKELSENTYITRNERSKDILLLLEKNLGANDKYKNHLEHIYPKKPRKTEWKQFSENKEFVDLIGNHVMLPDELNKEVKNHEFSVKKAYIEKNEFDLTAFKYAKEVFEELEEFNPETVIFRGKKYAKELKEIFIDMNLLDKD